MRIGADQKQDRVGEQGVMLLGLVVAIFLILLALSVAAPRMAQQLRRDQEGETIHRGNQYVRAIQLYYKKVGTYPATIDRLEKTNNIRFLRRRYVDPMTGKDDWRLIHVGEAKTTVKGFFGQPLAGIASSGLGNSSGMTGATSPGGSAGATPSAFGTPSSGTGSSAGSSLGGSSSGFSLGGGSGSSNSSGGMSSQSATTFSGSSAPFVGVGLVKDGNSITVLNEQTTYATWEFIYDPRIEQMKAKSNLFGGGPASSSPSSMGSSLMSPSNNGTSPTPTPTPTPVPGPATNTPQ
jgi:type II secretory pathway pseudopilin PulG